MDFHEHRRKRRGEDLFGLIMVVISVGIFWQAYSIAGLFGAEFARRLSDGRRRDRW